MKITLSKDNNSSMITLPYVAPDTFTIRHSVNEAEDAPTMNGNYRFMKAPTNTEIDINGFFPARAYPFLVKGAKTNPNEYIEWLEKVGKKSIRCVISDENKTIINEVFTITSFQTEAPQRNGDVNYTLELTQYRSAK